MTRATEPIVVAPKNGYLSITLPAYKSAHSAEARIAAMADAIEKHQAPRVLIDLRATHQRIPILALYELCTYMVATFRASPPKIAAVISPQAAYHDHFGENVLRNRGLDFIRFVTHEAAAIDWLLDSETAAPR